MKIIRTPKFLAIWERLGMDPLPEDAKEFTARLQAAISLWQNIATLINVKVG